MNSSSSFPKEQLKQAGESELGRQFGAWRRMLAECGRKPSRRRVHALRVATLRLQARTEHCLNRLGEDDSTGRVVRRWNKQADKLRNALSLVRETDVHLAKLNQLRRSVGTPDEDHSRLNRICLSQIATVEGRLERTRRSAAKKLGDEIEKRRGRLARLSKEIAQSPMLGKLLTMPSDKSERFSLIAGLAADANSLNARSLHEYRKRIKTVRYLAEMAADDDALAARQVTALRTMQSAVGEWHDRQSLSKEVSAILKGRQREGELVDLLKTLAGESFERALEVCRRTITRLLEESYERPSSVKELPARRPVQEAELPGGLSRSRYA